MCSVRCCRRLRYCWIFAVLVCCLTSSCLTSLEVLNTATYFQFWYHILTSNNLSKFVVWCKCVFAFSVVSYLFFFLFFFFFLFSMCAEDRRSCKLPLLDDCSNWFFNFMKRSWFREMLLVPWTSLTAAVSILNSVCVCVREREREQVLV